MRVNPVLDQIGSHSTTAIQDRARHLRDSGHPLVDFSIGDPREPTAPFIPAAVKDAVPAVSQYPTTAGLPRLRQAIAVYVERRFGVVVDPDSEVLPTTDSKESIFSAPLAFVDREAPDGVFRWTMQSTDEHESPRTERDNGDTGTGHRRVSRYSPPFDVARRFARPSGLHSDDRESRIIKTERPVVRLLPVTDRRKQLLGDTGSRALADEVGLEVEFSPQLSLFPERPPTAMGRRRRRGRSAAHSTSGDLVARHVATTLDRVHAALLQQGSGRSQTLRNLLQAEYERGPDFRRLTNALTALYPRVAVRRSACWTRCS